jgi:hypothetical protein
MMKKRCGIFIVLLLIISITGCSIGKANLQCTSKGSAGDIGIEQTYIIYYNKENVSSVNVTKTYNFEDKTTFKSFKTVINNTTSNMNSMNKDYIKFDVLEKSQKYITTLQVDMKSITNEELETLGLSKKVSDLKQKLEDQGLICK